MTKTDLDWEPYELTTTPDLAQWARTAALATSTRVRVFGGDGTLVVDSGSPSRLSADELLQLGSEPGSPGSSRSTSPIVARMQPTGTKKPTAAGRSE